MSDTVWTVDRLEGRWRGVCECGWKTSLVYYPGFAESRVRQHVLDKHAEATS